MLSGSALYSDALPAYRTPYPVDALGPNLSAAVRAIAGATQAPVELAAQAALAVVSLAVQGHVAVHVPTTEIRPVSCFFLTVADSGERKSAVAGLALRPVRFCEEALARDAPVADREYQASLAAWRLTRTRERRAAMAGCPGLGGETDAVCAEAKLLARKPWPPAPPFLVTTATAAGALADQLKARANLLVFADAPAFLAGLRRAPAAFFHDVWDAGAFTAGRGRAAERLTCRRLAIHLSLPPADARALFAAPSTVRDGLLSRFLIAAPVSRMGSRPWCEPAPCLDDFAARIGALLRPGADPPAGAELPQRVMAFPPAARRLWTAYADEMETRLADGGDFAALRAVGAKLPQQAARLAALLAAYEDENTPEIAEAHADGGIALARWYGAEALRLSTPPQSSAPRERAPLVLSWLKRVRPGRPFALADVYQHGPAAVRSAAAAREVLGQLEADGQVRRVPGRAEAWQLVQSC